MDHAAVTADLAIGYVERSGYYTALNEHVAGKGPPLIVTGEPGAGKSALLSNWAVSYRTRNPKESVVVHFVGASSESADHTALIRRIILELIAWSETDSKDRGGEGFEIPLDPAKLVDDFSRWLAKSSNSRRLVLVIDGLDHLENKRNALDLQWLPRALPHNVRLVVSVSPGPSLDALENREWSLLNVEPLEPGECEELIEAYFARFGKRLGKEQVATISAEPQSASPLFLSTVLSELRVFGHHDRLNEIIQAHFKAEILDELFARQLERFERDYEDVHPGLVGETLSLIWASRDGLTETEIRELAGVPPAGWSPLVLALEPSLLERSGLLSFANSHFRSAVETKFIGSPEARREAHHRLRVHFEHQELGDRQLAELPWHLKEEGASKQLKEYLTRLDVFEAFDGDYFKRGELVGHWHELRERYDLALEYQRSLNEFRETAPFERLYHKQLQAVALFLKRMDRLDVAIQLLEELLVVKRRLFGDLHPESARLLANLAESYLASSSRRYAILSWKLKRLPLGWFDDVAKRNQAAQERSRDGKFATKGQRTQEVTSSG